MKKCKFKGCKNGTKSVKKTQGYCVTHCTLLKVNMCKFKSCGFTARLEKRYGGYCWKHSKLFGFNICRLKHCETPSLGTTFGDFCTKHAREHGYLKCNEPECEEERVKRHLKYCHTHCIKNNYCLCSIEDCTNIRFLKGLCRTHGLSCHKTICKFCGKYTCGTKFGKNVCYDCSINEFGHIPNFSLSEISFCRAFCEKLNIKGAIHNDIVRRDGKGVVVINQYLPSCEKHKLATVDMFVSKRNLMKSKYTTLNMSYRVHPFVKMLIDHGEKDFGNNFRGLILQYDGPHHEHTTYKDNKRRTNLVENGYIVLVVDYKDNTIFDFKREISHNIVSMKELRAMYTKLSDNFT